MLERCVQTLKAAMAAANQNWDCPCFRKKQLKGRETPKAIEARET